MRYVIVFLCGVSSLLTGSMVLASPEAFLRSEVQESIQQLETKKSCPRCDLSGAILHRMDLEGANLEGANLAGAQLNLADMAGANLRNANLQGASFGGVDLAGADLTGANLTGAVIEGAYLAGAKMDGKVVVQEPIPGDGAHGGEKVYQESEGRSKHLPYTNTVIVAEKKQTPKKISPTVSDQSTVIAAQSSEKNRAEPSEPVDLLPRKSKQLSMLSDAVVGQNMKPKHVEAGVSERSISTVLEEKQIEDSSPIEVAAVELEEVSEDVGTPQNPESEPVVEEILIPEDQKQAGSVADSEAEKKKLLVEKLLDDNRCVACDLSGVDLSDKDLEDADLERANLKGANLREVDLEGANLKGADLSDTDLQHADLREADLYRANLSGADLTGVKFDDALIDSMISTGAKGANFKGAIGRQ